MTPLIGTPLDARESNTKKIAVRESSEISARSRFDDKCVLVSTARDHKLSGAIWIPPVSARTIF